jgi:Cu-Zn family superoxide dismutase
MIRKALTLATATVVTAMASVLLFNSQANAHDVTFRATLRDPQDKVVGTVKFRVTHHAMEVDARLKPNDNVTPNQFHGFHIHANNDPLNEEDCQADPDEPQSTWFMSADGHLKEGLQEHGAHMGDLPSPLVMADGTARLAFTTDRIDPGDLKGTAVILHKDPDDFRPATPTGNAGPRMACGVVRRAWWG